MESFKIIITKIVALNSSSCFEDIIFISITFQKTHFFNSKSSTKNLNEKHEWIQYDLSRAPEFGCHGNRLINYQNLATRNCSQVNLRKLHEV